MLENRDMPPTPERASFRWTATLVLIVINIAAFLLQRWVIPHDFTARYLNLSAYGISHGYLWELLSYQFLHGSFGHILFNCLTLYMFGRVVESELGLKRYVPLYLASGIFGGLLHIFAAFVWPAYFNIPVVGASAGIFGVVAAFAMLFPEQPLYFLFVIKMRAHTLLWIELVITALGIAFPTSSLMVSLFGNTAHTAHLGGILAGLALVGETFKLARSKSTNAEPPGKSPL